MRHRHQGWTVVEVLVSTTILTVLIVVMAEALNTTQRSWLSSRSAGMMQQNVDAAASMLSRSLQQATLQARRSFDPTLNQLVAASDLHFVCGPAVELLAGTAGVCGDAVFFQHPAADGALQTVLQACGFFVQYGADDVWRPTFSSALPAQRRFRLLQFHQPATSLTLFQTTGANGGTPRLGQLSSRTDLYAWFAGPISDSSLFKSRVSVVAENVVAMIVQSAPATQRCYDTRRYQWEAESAEAALSRHQLPGTLEITLVMVDEAGWARLAPEEAESFAWKIMTFVQGQSWQADAMPQGLTALQQMLQAQRLSARIAVIAIGGESN